MMILNHPAVPTGGGCTERCVPAGPGPAVCAVSVPRGQAVTGPCCVLLFAWMQTASSGPNGSGDVCRG